MAHLKRRTTNPNWIAVYSVKGKKIYKSTRFPHTTGDPEQDARSKASAQRMADLFQKAARKEAIKKALHLILDEIIDDAL